jgi:hypothetical protein
MSQTDKTQTVELPEPNTTLRVIVGLIRIDHNPQIRDAKVSSTGKTARLDGYNENKTIRLDRSDLRELLSGGMVIRGSETIQLYSPEKFHNQEKLNQTPPNSTTVSEWRDESKK